MAQEAIAIDKEAARKAADEMIARYSLNAEQSAEALKIQERRLRNEADIASLKASDNLLFLQKRKAIRLGTDASLKRMLNESQMAIFDAAALERRKKDSDFIAGMKQKNLTQEEMKIAFLEREGDLE